MAKFVTNFVGGSSKSTWARLGNGYTLNMYLETKDSGEHFYNKVLLPMPGQKKLLNVPGTPRGMFTAVGGFSGETVYFVAGESIYCIAGDTAIKIGSVGLGRISFDEIRTADKNFLLVADGSNLQAIDMTVNPALQSARQIPLPRRVNSDGSYGDNIRPTSVCVCYSMINVVDDGTDKFYTSVTLPMKLENGVVNYDAFAVSEAPRDYDGGERPYYKVGYYTFAETSADTIQALVTNGTSLFAIGKNSFDRFSYTGVAISKSVMSGVVWKCPKGQGGRYGTDDPNSVRVLGGSVYYLARNPNGGKSVVRLGESIEAISTTEIESLFDGSVNGSAFQWGQHPFYVLNANEYAVAYDVREGVWVNLDSGVVDYTPYKDDVYIQFDGGIGSLTSNKWTNYNNNPIIRKRCGIIANPNNDEIQLDRVSIVTNAGQYKTSGKTYKASFRWSCDGVTWDDTGIEELGKTGVYDYELTVYDLGIGKNFNVEISSSEDIPFCIYGISVDASVCDL